ncbi:DNA-binding protein [Bacillus cereus]|uniref:helix-turn-helix domain-containing protein n=1 Tax=Bacillus cereus group TaxID=86661 RepID=UPI000772B03F|nr:helix-turn-helix domain-containing protein [Bacillus cereus]MED2983821.1 helix-turn-helix domain-containing protein [Bacillus thuringiensis]AZV68879.1 DNA-binding protein [Bacillus cereus]KXI67678.1 hypothetical protein ACS51_19535 [Bacillus cereus]MDZ4406363.1 helix-turn-helix domain-containing protein [Bacillus cereus]MRB59793.1 DNA-binding protein [Bacillus thuringiensis]
MNTKDNATFISKIETVILKTLKKHFTSPSQEWMSISEATKYIGVSYNTFVKFRHQGLKICEIDGIKRVSKKEIDDFLNKFSF